MVFSKKRIFLSLVILAVCSSGIFAQEQAQAQENEVKKNSAGFSLTVFGMESHYERNFNNYLSVLGSVSYTTLFFMDKFTISAKGRLYPLGKAWYLGLGTGYMYGGVSDYRGGATGALLVASVYFFPLIILVPFAMIGEAAEYIKQTSRESGFLVQTNMGWKIPGKRWAVLIDTGLDVNITGIARSVREEIERDSITNAEGKSATVDAEFRPEYLLHFAMPYIRLGFDFRF